jgi:chloramphenicol-sensitive protein RarD
MWGLLPLYWHLLNGVPASQVISNRIIWSCVLLGLAILVTRQGRVFRKAVAAPRTLGVYALAAVLISINWFTYVWAVNAGFVIETSLGYFINPLISVLLGVAFLHERLRRAQWAAVGVAAGGVLYLTWTYGSLPWIALTLAVSFALYGLVKKLAPLNSVQGLGLETGLLFLPALAYLFYVERTTGGQFGHTSASTTLLLIGCGVVTTVPLVLFASASKRIPLLWLGLLQYIAPTIQFFLGIFVFHEAMTAQRFVGFVVVWVALAIFSVEGVLAHRSSLPVTTD